MESIRSSLHFILCNVAILKVALVQCTVELCFVRMHEACYYSLSFSCVTNCLEVLLMDGWRWLWLVVPHNCIQATTLLWIASFRQFLLTVASFSALNCVGHMRTWFELLVFASETSWWLFFNLHPVRLAELQWLGSIQFTRRLRFWRVLSEEMILEICRASAGVFNDTRVVEVLVIRCWWSCPASTVWLSSLLRLIDDGRISGYIWICDIQSWRLRPVVWYNLLWLLVLLLHRRLPVLCISTHRLLVGILVLPCQLLLLHEHFSDYLPLVNLWII